MGCGSSNQNINPLNIPANKITLEGYLEKKSNYLKDHQTFNLILTSNNQIYNNLEKLKNAISKENFNEEFDDFWILFSTNFESNKIQVKNWILESKCRSFIDNIANSFVDHYNSFDFIKKSIQNYINLNDIEVSDLKSILTDTEFVSINHIGFIYKYTSNFISNQLFTFSHLNSFLNFDPSFNLLSILHLDIDVTFPLDPININRIGEIIENKNLEKFSILFMANIEDYEGRKSLIEYNFNQCSLVLFRAVKNSTIKHFSIEFSGKTQMVKHKIELSNLFYFSIIEVIKVDKLITFSLVQFTKISPEILKCFHLIFKNLKNLRCLILDIDEIADHKIFMKEINQIQGLNIFINILYKLNQELGELLKQLDNKSLKFIKLQN